MMFERVRGFANRNQVWLLLLAAVLIRLPGLTSKPLWYDEAFAALFSAKGPLAMAYGTLTVEEGIAADVHPLGFYTLLWIWGGIFGRSPLSLRSLSLLLGVGVVGLGYVLTLRVFSSRAAILAGVGLAFSPFLIRYSQEVRMYSLLTVLLLGATIFLWSALDKGAKKHWLFFSLLAACAQYTHNLAFLYLVPLSVTPILLRRRTATLKTLLAGGFAILLYLPWFLRLPSQFARVEWAYWIEKPGLAALVRTFLTFFVGLPVQPDQYKPPVFQLLLGVSLFLTVLVLALGIWASIKTVRSKGLMAGWEMWFLYLACAPVGLMFIISQWLPIYLDRAMLTAYVALLIWLTISVSPSSFPRVYIRSAWVSIAGLYLIGLMSYFSYRGFPYAPFEAMNHHFRENIGVNEIILHSNKISALPAVYYDPDQDHRYLADPPGSASDTLARSTQEVLGLLAYEGIESAVAMAEGVWFVIFPREVEDYQSLGFPNHPALLWLEASFAKEEVIAFDELRVHHFFGRLWKASSGFKCQ
jgi:4-amino-4-deoxy-L-arabinose transferase-like glycosyltransferase